MKKKIYITESQFHMLVKEQEELTFYSFYNSVLSFIKELRQTPSSAKVDKTLESNGITREKLINSLIENGVLSRKQNKPIEVEGENGKKTAKWAVKYDFSDKKMTSENCMDKIKAVYDSLYKLTESTDVEVVDEEDDSIEETVSAGGAPSADGAGQVITKNCGIAIDPNDPTYKRDNLVRRSMYQPKK